MISSLPPQRQFASHRLAVIIILDDKLRQLPLPRQKIPASRILPRHGEGSFFPRGKKTKRPFQAQLFFFFFKFSLSVSLGSVCYFTAVDIGLEANRICCHASNFHLPRRTPNPAAQVGSRDAGLDVPILQSSSVHPIPPHSTSGGLQMG